jgi:hypothetical protein
MSSFYRIFLASVICLGNLSFATESEKNLLFRGYLSHTEGRGIGYDTGYTSTGIFAPLYDFRVSQIHPFFDVRAHVFNDGKIAVNVGGGMRFACPSYKRIFGINLYYDGRSDCGSFNQIGLGLEMLGRQYDVRVNGYAPFFQRKNTMNVILYQFPVGTQATCTDYQHALPGVDGEVGTFCLGRYLCSPYFSIYTAIGPYFYHDKYYKLCDGCGGQNLIGGRLRVIGRYSEVLSLEVRATYDRFNHGIVQGILSFNFPVHGAKKAVCGESYCGGLTRVVNQPVERNEIIVLEKKYGLWKEVDADTF